MVRRTLTLVFTRPQYVALAAAVAALVFAAAVWLPNWRLILILAASSSVSLGEMLGVLANLLLSIGTNFTVLSASYTIAIAVLFGVNVSLLVYYIRTRRAAGARAGGALSVGGRVSGAFGIGCASCGTFILTAFLGLIGAGGALALLPLGGAEFGVLGVVLTGTATYWTIKKMNAPLACSIESSR